MELTTRQCRNILKEEKNKQVIFAQYTGTCKSAYSMGYAKS